MTKKICVFLLVVAAIAFSTGGSRATVIWDNGPPNLTYGEIIDNSDGYVVDVADDFELPAGTVITDIHFTMGEAEVGYNGEPIQWTFYEDTFDGFFQPGAVIDSGFDLNTQVTPIDENFSEVSFYLDHQVVWPGGFGWLGLFVPGTIDGIVAWGATDSSHGAIAVSRFEYGDWYQLEDNWDLAFQLTSIPEPSTLLLLVTGLLGVVGIARRRKG